MWPHKRGSVSRVYTDKHASRGYHHQPVVGTLVPKSFIPSTFPEVLQCFRAGPSKGSAKSYTTYRSPVHTTWKVQGLLCVEPEHSETSCLLVLRQVASVGFSPPTVRTGTRGTNGPVRITPLHSLEEALGERSSPRLVGPFWTEPTRSVRVASNRNCSHFLR